MKKGYVSFKKKRKKISLDKLKEVKPLWHPPKGYFRELTQEFWDGDKLKDEYKNKDGQLPSTWIWWGGKMTLVDVYDRHRKVLWKKDKDGKPIYRLESYTTYKMHRNTESGSLYVFKNGEWVEESPAALQHGDEGHTSLVKEKEDVKPPEQLSLFR